MKLLVIGSGGREHALAWKLAQSPRVSEVIVAPGNAGTAREGKCRNAAVKATDIDGLLRLAQDEGIALTVVGPEQPLVAGVVDAFRAEGHRIFGPTAAAAQLDAALASGQSALAEGEQSAGSEKLPPAVIMDVDETVLDNSPYQARLVMNGKEFDDLTWDQWVAEKKAKPVPIFLFGSDYWKRLINFDVLVEEGAISAEDLALFRYVDEPEAAWEGIKRFYDLPDTCPCQEDANTGSGANGTATPPPGAHMAL